MNESKPENPSAFIAGYVEPHSALLKRPPDDQLLYKVVRIEDLLRSVSGSYLHFTRVDSYRDFIGADARDGQQLPRDEPGNARSIFTANPKFSAADYYDRSRSRTYAFCLSVENSAFIWRNYGTGGNRGKACVVFRFDLLRSILNRTLQTTDVALEYNGLRCQQIFSINYGLVEYIDWKTHQENMEKLPNPIVYTYLKDRSHYKDEQELRISLSALVGTFVLRDGSEMAFPPYLQLSFDFQAAVNSGAIREIVCAPGSDMDFLFSELNRLGVEVRT